MRWHPWALARSIVVGSVARAPLSVLLVGAGLVAGCTVMTDPTMDAGSPVDAPVDAPPVMLDADPLPAPVIDRCTPEGMGATIGESCAQNAVCDDGCYCNGVERCEAGVCVAGADPCLDAVDCTVDACLEEADRCFHDPQHGDCSDGDACNGLEVCDLVVGCTPGAPPYCNDESSCTLDSCDPAIGCVFEPRDLDGDGFRDGRCGGDDCDDDPRFGADIYPGAPEDCSNRRDDDCDGLRDYHDTAECVPTNDNCASAEVLPGPGTYSGSTAGLGEDFDLACRTSRGPDAVYRFTLTEVRDVTVTVSGGGSGAGVSLRSFETCAGGTDDVCGNGSPPRFLRRSLPAGEWVILVQTGSGTPFDLTLRFDEPTEIPSVDVCDAETEDLCGGAPCETLTATFAGVFAETQDDYVLSCASGAGTTSRRDAAYTFTIDATKDVLLQASTRDDGGNRTAYVSLSTDCGDPSAQLRCRTGSPATLRQRELPAGTYFVLIESSDSDPVSWALDVTITDPVPRTTGDACSTAIDISEPAPGAGAMGSVELSTLELDSGTSCGGDSASFRDATFTFTLESERDVAITTGNGTSTQYAALATSCTGGEELRCWSGSSSAGVTQSWRSLPAGAYWLTVSTARSSGALTASLLTSAPTPIPPNDRCDGAIELVDGTIRRDTTIDLEDDGMGGTCAGSSRPDAFYRFSLATRQYAVITVRDAEPAGTTTFYLSLLGVCGGTATLCRSGSTNVSLAEVLEPGDYILMVETPSTDRSDFDILASFFAAPGS